MNGGTNLDVPSHFLDEGQIFLRHPVVGFPTESDAEYEETFNLMNEVRYDTAFIFKYSERPLTKASKLVDDIPDDVKVARLERLINLQQKIARERNEAQVGRKTEILIEGLAPQNSNMWSGRTPDFRPVVMPQNGEQIGDLVPVRLDSLTGFTFHASKLS